MYHYNCIVISIILIFKREEMYPYAKNFLIFVILMNCTYCQCLAANSFKFSAKYTDKTEKDKMR